MTNNPGGQAPLSESDVVRPLRLCDEDGWVWGAPDLLRWTGPGGEATDARARKAAGHLADAGTDVRYLRAIFVPEDELCLYLLDAVSIEAACDLIRRAGISPNRIVEAAS